MEKRDIQLGMSYSTAMSRLERKVIFWLAQKVDLDVCYCCGKKIERPEDLSIEHKLPWLNIDPVLGPKQHRVLSQEVQQENAAPSTGRTGVVLGPQSVLAC